MPVIIDHVPVNQPVGTQQFGPANINNGTTMIIVRLARKTTATPTFWPDASTVVGIELEVSYDGGNTWEIGGGFHNTAGDIRVSTRPVAGIEQAESVVQCPLRAGTGRRVRANVSVAGNTLVSQLTVEVI